MSDAAYTSAGNSQLESVLTRKPKGAGCLEVGLAERPELLSNTRPLPLPLETFAGAGEGARRRVIAIAVHTVGIEEIDDEPVQGLCEMA